MHFFFVLEQRLTKNIPKRKRSFILPKTKSVDKTKHKDQNAIKKSESDDSIGSASDLRARQEQEELDEKEDSETMTVNDSVLTCGSSAYHAECESMAREELPSIRRYPRMADVPEHKELNSLFLGHTYADKPLLADDELDKGDNVSPAPLIDMTDEQKDTKDEDVFSMAPFKMKKKCKEIINASQDDLLITMSPNVAEGSLVDLDDKSFYEAKPGSSASYTPFSSLGKNEDADTSSITAGTKAVFEGVETVADNNPFSATFNTSLVGVKKEDLFGSVPFDRMAVSVTNSSRNSNEVDDFINFGGDTTDEYSSVSIYGTISTNYRRASAGGDGEYVHNTGISNMSFEEHPNNGSDFADLSFPKVKQQTAQVFFHTSKSNNNPFS